MSQTPESRTLLITGATGGMGRACALLAAGRGYDLMLSDLDEGKLQALAAECARSGISARHRVMDVTDAGAVRAFAADLAKGSPVDAVIHTLGLSPHMAAWDKIVEVDLVGTVDLLEQLRAAIKPGGSAVCIASMSGHMVPANAEIDALLSEPLAEGLLQRLAALPDSPMAHSGIAYAYAKRALLAYVRNEALAWGAEGKRLVSISPGLIDTDMGRLEAESDKEAYEWMRPLVALKRDGLPGEIASAALFLASEEASYISGCDLLVDGGFVGSFMASQQ